MMHNSFNVLKSKLISKNRPVFWQIAGGRILTEVREVLSPRFSIGEQDTPPWIETKAYRVDCQKTLIDGFFKEFNSIGEEHEDIFHRNYGEIDSGNVIDEKGDISEFLDTLRQQLGLRNMNPKFDKLSMRKSRDWAFGGLHADHYVSHDNFVRKRGKMFRTIINLGTTDRYVAFLNIDPVEVSRIISDPINYAEYKAFTTIKRKLQIYLIRTPPPIWSTGSLFGLRFDTFNLIHCGVGSRGTFAAVLSEWVE